MDAHLCQATLLSTLHTPFHLTLTTTLGGRYSYAHLTDKEAEGQRSEPIIGLNTLSTDFLILPL